MMRIITRAEWSARYPTDDTPVAQPAAEVWLHHSVSPSPRPGSSFALDITAVQLLERICQTRFGNGMSYTWVLTPAGRVFEGHPRATRGTHTKDHNSIGRGICWIGNYETEQPSEALVQVTVQLLVHAYRSGWVRAPRFDGGHRDVKATACPGRLAYAQIPRINAAAAALTRGAELTEEESRQLAAVYAALPMIAEVHAQLLSAHDYRHHHSAPDDVEAGQVLSTRRELHAGVGALSGQLAAMQEQLADIRRQLPAGAPE